MKKRFLAYMLTMALLLTLIPAAALAADPAGSAAAQTTAAASGTCGEQLSWVLDQSGTLTISGSGSMDDYLVEGAPEAPWYDQRDSIRHVIIADGVTTIGSLAFLECSHMESIIIPGSVTDLGYETFCNCLSLQSVTIPEGVSLLLDGVFEGCSGLKSVSIPESVTCIQALVFEGCSGLETVTLPDSVAAIYSNAFEGCSSLKSIAIPDGNQYIDTRTFLDCTGLQTVTIPGSIDCIDVGAFQHCGCLQSVYFDGTLEQLSAVDVERENDGLQHAAVYVHPNADTKEYVPASSFTDVPDLTQYYFVPVLWAAGAGITAGTTDTTFAPDDTCTRAEAVTFLYRAAGEPTVSGSNPFRDVRQRDYYYDAVLWASQEGITFGTAEHTFSPDQTVSRAEFITFLCRFAGAQDQTYRKYRFNDVQPGQYYYNAVYWGFEEGIVSGTDRYLFSPDDPCTRAQVVTFLWRYRANL